MSLDLDGPYLWPHGIGKFSSGVPTGVAIGRSICNIAGYFPLVGIITGIFRIVFGFVGLEDPHEPTRTSSKVVMIRGIIEILGAGSLFAVVDVGCSIARLVREHRDAAVQAN
jgi:hypothetical protein